MRQKCAKMGLVLLGKEERSKMRENCVKNASKMRGTPLGENTFWTIPNFLHCPGVFLGWLAAGVRLGAPGPEQGRS